MANSYIVFYKTAIDPNRNMVVEEIEDYLATCPHTAGTNIMYIKPGMDAQTVVEWPQATGWVPDKTTYAKVTTDGKIYYYFVTETEWKGQSSVGLKLHLDTINTYWNDYKDHFTDRTHITRQHKNRFLKNGAREIDEFDEGITPVLQYLGHEIIGASSPLWYLIYKSDTNAEDSTVSCYACSAQEYRISSGQSAPTVRWDRSQFTSGTYYYLIPEDDIANPEIGVEYGVSGYVHVAASNTKPIIKIYLDNNGYVHVKRYNRDGTADSGYPFESALSYVDFIYTRRLYYGTVDTIQLEDINNLSSMTLQSGNIGDLKLATIDSIERTDNQLIKILELGYAPFEIVVTSGNLQIPTGWEYDEALGLLKLNSLNTEFLNPNIGTYNLANIEYALNFNVDVNAAPSVYYESKLYNSNFYSLKFAYDTESYVVKPERIHTYSSISYNTYPQFVVSYKPSNGINSNCAFKFTHQPGTPYSGYHDGLDYEGILVSTRNNELPLYNNEYLNYLKYGKQYADRQTSMNVGATWLSTLLSIGGGVAAGAIVGAAPGAIIGGIVGAISGVSTAITSTVKAIDAQQQKEWELQHQATNVTGNSDLDIFKWYSDGKLHVFRREPTSKMKNLLFTLFFRGGYACDDYGVPNLNSRYWFNFIQCVPSFDLTQVNIYQPFLDDIYERYQAGVTIFHEHHGVRTFDYDKENWEVGFVRGDMDATVQLDQDAFFTNIDVINWQSGDVVDVAVFDEIADWEAHTPSTVLAATHLVDNHYYCTDTGYEKIVAIQARVRNGSSFTGPWITLWKNSGTPLYYNWVKNMDMDDTLGFVGTYDGSIALDGVNTYLEFKWEHDGQTETADSYGTVVNPHTNFHFGEYGQYQYQGAVISWRIVSTDPAYITSDWGQKTM